jgi:hypothetical protein
LERHTGGGDGDIDEHDEDLNLSEGDDPKASKLTKDTLRKQAKSNAEKLANFRMSKYYSLIHAV